ncbi:MAG: hypothetical protein A3J62_03330 [Candidatus Buchananbacteria bacterium RIFCSPHIGHO2_02_FULL_38_8]|uniref:ZIP zinc transporter n=1 Tax=Candidatus Buchananbacteria bacterium RIFCSPHIGHO2_02_FULL_38_8 TaxID=1797538 RepID=A0A1G1Y5E5_9BACT|nr:MAG: hypothetical protein A3J62_03330 [Candidatus Buchananbacteria bacterium RIFCSPHIGHO2_02_FULL_38_8]
MLISIILATTIIGLISLTGVILIFNREIKPEFSRSLVSLAAGSLLAVALLDILPESIEESHFEPHFILGTVLISILFFFLFERVLHWHHCRCEYNDLPCSKDKKNLIYLNLSGDAIHNLVDGFLVASAFMLNFQTGITVTLAVILHEIPQEISDFGVLLYAGLTKLKALLYNLFIALTAIVGAIAFYSFGNTFQAVIPLMAAFAAGNFIYLATADLIPELHHEKNPQTIALHSIWLIIGVIIIFLVGLTFPHSN